jgi:hypothetical protein
MSNITHDTVGIEIIIICKGKCQASQERHET